MEVIKVENLSKKFKKRNLLNEYNTLKNFFLRKQHPSNNQFTHALKDINFTVKKGNTVGIVGHNGSGKSTILKILSKIYRPDSGQFMVHGRVSALIELGVGFHPDFSGRENVFINGLILGLPKKEIKALFDKIIQYANLENFVDAPVRTYSTGMYMRLAFSIAIHVDPDILLIDEVLAVGDEAFKQKCYDKIEEFQNQGKTIIIASHDLSMIEKWCSEVIWLDHGNLKKIGPPKNVIDSYVSSVTNVEKQNGKKLTSKMQRGAKEQGRRWGTKEIEIISVLLLDDLGKECFSYATGGKMSIEVSYKVHKYVADPVFGVGFYRPDGICCFGTNTEIENLVLPAIKTNGVVRFKIDQLDLIEGEYHLDIAVHDKDGNAFDYLSRFLSFYMHSDIKDTGIFRINHKWEFK